MGHLRICVVCLIIGVVIATLCFDTGFVQKVKERKDTVVVDVYNENFEEYDKSDVFREDIECPIILWWTPFTLEPGKARNCGAGSCFFTNNRHYFNHSMTMALMFYGSNMDLSDLPLPRQSNHEWALLHEESPKNSYYFSHEDIMMLFNHTSTFRRESDFPLTLLYLNGLFSLGSKQYMISTAEKNRLLGEGLALINYVQSDCEAPSDRDHLVEMLMKYIRIDSYGRCLHNKDLPAHLRDPLSGMGHADFVRLQAQYKFTLALENAVCNDYITEKLWRPLEAGSVPIVFGSPRVKDYLPNNKSAIIVDDFHSVKELVDFLLKLNNSDAQYDSYLSHKNGVIDNDLLHRAVLERKWSTDKHGEDFVSKFECLVCNRLQANAMRKRQNLKLMQYIASERHYGCPPPKKFSGVRPHDLNRVSDRWWSMEWEHARVQAATLRRFLNMHRYDFTSDDLMQEADALLEVHNQEL